MPDKLSEPEADVCTSYLQVLQLACDDNGKCIECTDCKPMEKQRIMELR